MQGDSRNASTIQMYESCGFTCKANHMEKMKENDKSKKRFPEKNKK